MWLESCGRTVSCPLLVTHHTQTRSKSKNSQAMDDMQSRVRPIDHMHC